MIIFANRITSVLCQCRNLRLKAIRSFPNRYLFSLHNKVTSLFSIRYILIIILSCKTAYFERRNNSFCKTLIIKRLDNTHHYKKYLHASLCVLLISLHVTNAVLLYENVLIVRRNSTQKITF